jgi:hypothetical protein
MKLTWILIAFKVKAHYIGQNKFLKILFFKIVSFSTSTKSILKDFFINYTQNKVVQLSNNAIVKRNYILKLLLNDLIVHLWKINTCTNVL